MYFFTGTCYAKIVLSDEAAKKGTYENHDTMIPGFKLVLGTRFNMAREAFSRGADCKDLTIVLRILETCEGDEIALPLTDQRDTMRSNERAEHVVAMHMAGEQRQAKCTRKSRVKEQRKNCGCKLAARKCAA